MRRVLLPVLFTGCFIFESIFIELMPAKFFSGQHILVPHLLIMAILFLTIYGNRNLGILYGFIFGLLFDVVYTEVVGIYLFMFPVIAYLISKIMKVLQTNLIIVSIVTLLGVGLLEIGVYEMNFLIHRTTMGFPSFFGNRLVPTLVLNLIFIILVAYPLKRQFEKLADQLRNE
ncbi:rod shape-determining protein MreD [Bacillus sp. 1NLA3E]|uniref:rod shape-determining protein MreD n=1 Tax=Bacillus sp. 1NLA3E TaxID=666686 RepID=UPI000247EB1B|nr:rod shape-determining protein MreD [Bacillus sp. 1NLA3E]AGK55078.1 rod shape-determining protein MreD [Bacillus sp. 1NLA3E]